MTSTPESVFVVQFPHPGSEHNPGAEGRMGWNTGDHARKFIRSTGRYVEADGRRVESELVFWGEWEAQSLVVDRWPDEGHLPRFLHVPIWIRPSSSNYRQNTDPWVFGHAFSV